MALGIPVLCPRTSIHAEYIRDGVDGILYDDAAGALEALASLRSDPARSAAMGAAIPHAAPQWAPPLATARNEGSTAARLRTRIAGLSPAHECQ